MTLTLTKPVRQGGRYSPGQSGHPGGRPRERTLVELCKANTEEAVKTLIVAMRFKGPQQVPAAIAILDRGWGKPTQRIESQGDHLHLHLLAAQLIEPQALPHDAGAHDQPQQPLVIDGTPPTE